MERKFFFSDTWQGTLFGLVFSTMCWTIFVAPQIAFVLELALPEWREGGYHGIASGAGGGLIAISYKIWKSYWDWADRVMGKLFRRSRGGGENV